VSSAPVRISEPAHFYQDMSDTNDTIDIAAYIRTIGAPRHALTMRELKPLSGIGADERSRFFGAWRGVPTERRSAIVQAMVELSEDNVDLNFHQFLIWCLEDESDDVRAMAIEGLWENESLTVMRQLLDMLASDTSERVRAAAATGLSRFAYEAELGELDDDIAALLQSRLLALIDDPQQPVDVRRRAIESAGYFANNAAIQQRIEETYATGEQLQCESALVAMGRSMLQRWLPTIGRELGHASPARRYEAARAAGELADNARSLVPQLAPLVNDTDGEIAEAAIWALGQIGGAAARRTLQQLSKSQDEARSQAAIEALEELSLESGFLGGDWRRSRGQERQN
jgi:HEAT repeat protein